ncbi:MAG: hydantoinase/oxoprolinase family protein [Alphaproteobacteria bacterium]
MQGRIGVEIGGTFTDLVWRGADGALAVHKVLSTPEALDEGVMRALDESGARLAEVRHVVHGSTVATNALLTRQGAATGLVTTRGFRDVIELGTHDRSGNVYEIFYEKPRSPIPRRHVREVDERVAADGAVVAPIDLEAAWAEIEALIAAGVGSIAICFLHSYRNAAHEKALAALLRERAPEIFVTASHEISPEFREYERSMTTAVNAFVGPVVAGYLGALAGGLGERGFAGALQIMQSNGGVMPAQGAGTRAVRMLLSGPAAGVRGALWFARRNGLDDAVTLDMGGTSCDVCLAPGLEPGVVPELTIDRLPIRSPALDIVTVGAGGGSIARVDPGGFLTVGPESAGAAPGPACYGLGGEEATVTDAQVVAGILRPERFLGGRMTLAPDSARAALTRVGLDAPVEGVADSVLRVVNNNMAGALRLVSTARGIDPRDFALVAYGGGGPIHAAMVAEEVGIGRVLVPWSPGLVSAFGLLVADLTVDLARTRIHQVDDGTLDAAVVGDLTRAGLEAAAAQGLDADACELRLALDLRYAGQAYELTVWIDDAPADADHIRDAFSAAHRRRYGYAREALPVEAVNYRVRVVQRLDDRIEPPAPPAGAEPVLERGEIGLAGERIAATFADRASLAPGFTLDGPAVIEEATATTLAPPGWRIEVLASGDLMLERSAQ